LLLLSNLSGVDAWNLCKPYADNKAACPVVSGLKMNYYKLGQAYTCSIRECSVQDKGLLLRCAGKEYNEKDLLDWGPCHNDPDDPATTNDCGPQLGDKFILSSLILAIVGILVGLCGIVFLVKFWDRPIIIMSQRVILVLLCIGVITLNIGVVLVLLDPRLCMASFGLVELSLTLLISCIGVKEWRAWQVRFNSLKFQKVKITDKLVYGLIAGAVVVTLIFVIADSFSSQGNISDSGECNDEMLCTFGVWFYVFWAYLILLNLVATTLAFMTRDVPSVAGDSSSILHASFFTLFSMVILALVFLVESIPSDLKIFLLSFVVFWISLCYMIMIIFRKIAWMSCSAKEIVAIFMGENKTFPSLPTNEDAAASKLPHCDSPGPESCIESKKKKAYHIATADGWEEYVDRETGETFWIQTATGELAHNAPSNKFEFSLA